MKSKIKRIKGVFVLISFGLLIILLGCEKESDSENKSITACGVENPTENLAWLAEIISKAESDNTGNYLGQIWIKKYNDTDYIVTNMAMGSGGIMYYCFNCNGVIANIVDIDFYNSLTDNEIVYSNIP